MIQRVPQVCQTHWQNARAHCMLTVSAGTGLGAVLLHPLPAEGERGCPVKTGGSRRSLDGVGERIASQHAQWARFMLLLASRLLRAALHPHHAVFVNGGVEHEAVRQQRQLGLERGHNISVQDILPHGMGSEPDRARLGATDGGDGHQQVRPWGGLTWAPDPAASAQGEAGA